MKKRIFCLLLTLGLMLTATPGISAAAAPESRPILTAAIDTSPLEIRNESTVTINTTPGTAVPTAGEDYATYTPLASCLDQYCLIGGDVKLYFTAYVPNSSLEQCCGVEIYYGTDLTEDNYIGGTSNSFDPRYSIQDIGIDWDTTGHRPGVYTVLYFTIAGSGSNAQVVEDTIVSTTVTLTTTATEYNRLYWADGSKPGSPQAGPLCVAKGTYGLTKLFARFDPKEFTGDRYVQYKSYIDKLEVASIGGYLYYEAYEYGVAEVLITGSFVGDKLAVYICTDDQGHDWKEVILETPTCTEPGSGTWECTKCGFRYGTHTVPTADHTWDEGEILAEETETEYGEKRYTCTVCGAQETRSYHTCPGKDFTDMPPEAHWAHKGIDYCLKTELMNGVGNGLFKPNTATTRGQLVTILWRQSGSPEPQGKTPFTDLNQDFYQKAVAWAYENGIVKGITETTFGPAQAVTREQFAAILYRYAENALKLDVSARADLTQFPDYQNAFNYSRESLSWANAVGLINGVGNGAGINYLQPKSSATRGQAATILARFCQSLPETPENPEVPENPENPENPEPPENPEKP